MKQTIVLRARVSSLKSNEMMQGYVSPRTQGYKYFRYLGMKNRNFTMVKIIKLIIEFIFQLQRILSSTLKKKNPINMNIYTVVIKCLFQWNSDVSILFLY